MTQEAKPVSVTFPSRTLLADLLGTTPENIANAIRRGGTVCGLPVHDASGCEECAGVGRVSRGFFSEPCSSCGGQR